MIFNNKNCSYSLENAHITFLVFPFYIQLINQFYLFTTQNRLHCNSRSFAVSSLLVKPYISPRTYALTVFYSPEDAGTCAKNFKKTNYSLSCALISTKALSYGDRISVTLVIVVFKSTKRFLRFDLNLRFELIVNK